MWCCFWGYLPLLNHRGCCLSSTAKSLLLRVALRGLRTLLETPNTNPVTCLGRWSVRGAGAIATEAILPEIAGYILSFSDLLRVSRCIAAGIVNASVSS